MSNYLVIVSGPPCSGKSTIANELSAELGFPLISKDQIKESLFDSLGYSDREWSRKLGQATYPIMYDQAEALLKAKQSFIIESNFDPRFDTDKFLYFKKKYKPKIITIQCQCDGQTLVERFKKRALSGERHPGHQDHVNMDEFLQVLLRGKSDPLELESTYFTLDTTVLGEFNLKSIIQYFQ